MNIAICEDIIEEQENIVSILKKSPLNLKFEIFSSGEEFLESYKFQKYDLIFMDIYMNEMTGVDVVHKIREFDKEVTIAFTTTSLDFALEGYRLNVLKYLEKPVKESDVFDVLSAVKLKNSIKPKFDFTYKRKAYSVLFEKIMYVEQRAGKLVLSTEDEEIEFSGKLKDIEEQFDSKIFFRCHKSFLVNLNYVESFDSELSAYKMSNGQYVYIRRESLTLAKKTFNSFMINKTRQMI